MITYINSENAKKYSRLFSEAEDALVRYWKGLGLSDDQIQDKNHFGALITDEETGEQHYENGISSLNTYFSWINDLLNINEIQFYDEDGNLVVEDFDGMKFSMLPIDEDIFYIDANSRKITVPPVFKANGISVQSDEISEVIYFKINRFYDATDLFNQDIMIEWITPKSEAHPEGLKGYSVPTVKVLDDSTNYIIFGWALSSDITEVAGDVTFAVRFFKYDKENNKIQYSLSSLTEKATIKPNIGLDIPRLLGSDGHLDGYKVLGDEIKALIRERAENSHFGFDGDKAVQPELYTLTVDPTNATAPYVVVLENGAATVAGCGFSTDGGKISYFWKKFDYDTGDRLQTDGDNKLIYADNYLDHMVTLATAKGIQTKTPAMKFYEIVTDGGTFKAAEEISLEKAEEKGLEKVACQYSHCDFDGVGYYKFVIKNRSGHATEVLESDPIIVYPASKPINVALTTDVEGADSDKVFLDDSDRNVITVKCEIPAAPDEDPAFARQNAQKVGYRDAEGNIVAKYAFLPKEEAVEYVWQFKGRNESTFAPIADSAETNKLNKSSWTPTSEGDYKCVLTGLLNENEAEPVESPICRVTYRPARPVLTVEGTAQNYNNKISISNNPNLGALEDLTEKEIDECLMYTGRNGDLELSYSLDTMKTTSNGLVKANHELTDSIDFQWYCYELKRDSQGHTVATPDKEDIVLARKGKYVPQEKASALYAADSTTGLPGDSFNVGELTASEDKVILNGNFHPAKDGFYFCMVTNHYNGMTETISTPIVFYDNTEDNNQ